MKKTFLTLFLMTTMFGAAYADGREKPTSVDKLPQAAQVPGVGQVHRDIWTHFIIVVPGYA